MYGWLNQYGMQMQNPYNPQMQNQGNGQIQNQYGQPMPMIQQDQFNGNGQQMLSQPVRQPVDERIWVQKETACKRLEMYKNDTLERTSNVTAVKDLILIIEKCARILEIEGGGSGYSQANSYGNGNWNANGSYRNNGSYGSGMMYPMADESYGNGHYSRTGSRGGYSMADSRESMMKEMDELEVMLNRDGANPEMWDAFNRMKREIQRK